MEREVERHREKSSICCFIPQGTVMARAGPSSAALPSTLAGILMGSGANQHPHEDIEKTEL